MSPEKQPPHAKNLRFGRTSAAQSVYFITKCVERPVKIKLTTEPVASFICDAILHRKHLKIWHILSFVIMPDHIHLLIALGDQKSLSKTVGGFSQFTASQINLWNHQKGSFWQHGFYEHFVRKAVEKCPSLTDYIHHNPVRKGLCKLPEQWPWSTAHAKYAPEVETDWFW